MRISARYAIHICMKEKLIHYRTCVCNINYHMVWSVKYRRKILNPEIEEYLKELVQQIAEDKGFTVHLFECGEEDHVHCFVTAPPKLSMQITKTIESCTKCNYCNQVTNGEHKQVLHSMISENGFLCKRRSQSSERELTAYRYGST